MLSREANRKSKKIENTEKAVLQLEISMVCHGYKYEHIQMLTLFIYENLYFLSGKGGFPISEESGYSFSLFSFHPKYLYFMQSVPVASDLDLHCFLLSIIWAARL